MDTITHGIVGALAGKTFFAGRDVPAKSVDGTFSCARSSPTSRTAIIACTIGSLFPDIDIFAGRLAHNPLAIMEWHRNITHSIVILPLWGLLLATMSLPLARWLRWTAPSFPRLFASYAVGLASHIFLDSATSFGTMALSPLGYSRLAWDWLFILDFTLTAFALVPQLAAWCYRDPQKFKGRAVAVWAALSMSAYGVFLLAASAGYGFSIGVVGIASGVIALSLFLPAIRDIGFGCSRANWCRVGVALVCAYLVLASGTHRNALADVDNFAVEHRLDVENRAAIPLPPTFTHWAGVISTPEGVWRTTFHEPGGLIERTQFYSDARSDRYVEEAKKLHDVQVYLWFARFPAWQVNKQNEQTIVDVSDVRFFREQASGTNSEDERLLRIPGIRPNPTGFTFEVVFNRDGQVISSGFKRPNND